MLKLGSGTINKVMLGSTEINKVYLGSTVVYESGDPPPWTDEYISYTPGAGSWEVPAGVTSISIEIWGGGGSGSHPGGAVLPPNTAYGGASGGYCKRNSKEVTPEQIISFTIGDGGEAASLEGGNGNNGVNSTCDSMTAGGGDGGTISQIPPSGGSASNGDINITGNTTDDADGANAPHGGVGGSGMIQPTAPGAGSGRGLSGNNVYSGAPGGIRIRWTA